MLAVEKKGKKWIKNKKFSNSKHIVSLVNVIKKVDLANLVPL